MSATIVEHTKERLKKIYAQFLTRMDIARTELDNKLRNLQAEYLQSLDEGDIQLLYFYTNIGDGLLNSYLRDGTVKVRKVKDAVETYKDTFTNKTTHFYRSLHILGGSEYSRDEKYKEIQSMCDKLRVIIMNAPTDIGKSFYVARGTKTGYNEDSKSFISATLCSKVSKLFADRSDMEEEEDCKAIYGYVSYLKIARTTPFIYIRALIDTLLRSNSTILPAKPKLIEPVPEFFNQVETEYEVLLPPGLGITLKKAYLEKGEKKMFEINRDTSLCGFYIYEVKRVDASKSSFISIRTEHGGKSTRRKRNRSCTRRRKSTP